MPLRKENFNWDINDINMISKPSSFPGHRQKRCHGHIVYPTPYHQLVDSTASGCPAVDYCFIWSWEYFFTRVSCVLVHVRKNMHLVKASDPAIIFGSILLSFTHLSTFANHINSIYIWISSNSTRTAPKTETFTNRYYWNKSCPTWFWGCLVPKIYIYIFLYFLYIYT